MYILHINNICFHFHCCIYISVICCYAQTITQKLRFCLIHDPDPYHEHYKDEDKDKYKDICKYKDKDKYKDMTIGASGGTGGGSGDAGVV